MAKLNSRVGAKDHKVVTQKSWIVARKALLLKEKKFTRLREQRRDLPWVKVEKEYVSDGPSGKGTPNPDDVTID